VISSHSSTAGSIASARNGHALLLAAGQLLGMRVELLRQTHAREQPARQCLGGGFGETLHARRRQHHVATPGQMRKQVEALEHHAHALPQRAHGARVVMQQRLAVDGELAGLESLQPVDAAEQRALARAALADDGDHFARGGRQVDALEHFERTEALVQGQHLDQRCCRRTVGAALVVRLSGRHAVSFPAAARTG
jgi:hypothetical protein